MSIIKLPCDGRDYYLEWSAIEARPVTFGMHRDEFDEWFCREYGHAVAERDLPRIMRRLDANGTTRNGHKSVDETILFNRAGKDGTRLSVEQIVDHWIRRRPSDDENEPELPMGEVLDDEEDG